MLASVIQHVNAEWRKDANHMAGRHLQEWGTDVRVALISMQV